LLAFASTAACATRRSEDFIQKGSEVKKLKGVKPEHHFSRDLALIRTLRPFISSLFYAKFTFSIYFIHHE
jgi:hypothetical protein